MIIARLVIMASLLTISTAHAADEPLSDRYCDYYDSYSSMLISFPEKAQLMETSPSALSGIGMTLPDGSHLGIAPTMADEDFDKWDGISNTRGNWLDRYMETDCRLVMDMPKEKARHISCPRSEHILLYQPAESTAGADIYIFVNHEFEGSSPSPYFQKIMDSLQLFRGKEADDAYRIISETGYPSFNPADPFDAPRHFCGKYRVRSSILSGDKTKDQ